MKKENITINRRLLQVSGLVFLLILSTYVSLEAQTYGNIWQNGNFTTHEEIWDVVFTGDRFVAGGIWARVYRSNDGKTWTKQTIPILDSAKDAIFGVEYDSGSGRMVASCRDGLIISSDDQGATWAIRRAKVGGSPDFYNVAFGNNMFLIVAEDGGIWKSTDGIAWTNSASLNVGCRNIAFGNGWFMVASVPGKMYRSTNGTTWSSAYLGGNIKAMHYTNYGTPKWVAVGGKIWTSTNNGSSWTKHVTLSDYGIVTKLYCVTSAPGPSIIAAGDGGLMLNSTDGITWRKADSKTLRMILGMTHGPGKSVVAAVGTGAPRNPMALLAYSTRYSTEGGAPGPVLEPPSGNTIKITAPNGGEVLEGGSKFTIKWTGSITFDKIDIEYYDGSQWVVIVNGTEDDGSYSWTVPKINTTKARLWIKGWHSSDNAVDYTNSTFTIGGEAAEINITAPNGGEILTGGNIYTIRWQSSITFDKVDIEYYNGSQWAVIKNGTGDDGAHPWTVPNISTTKARLWIKGWSANGNPVDFTDNDFTITPAPSGAITVTSPNGGEVWAKGSTENITWTTSGEVGNARIFYSTNDGFNWTTIVSSTANDGSYAWKLPDILADDCLVKVRDAANSQISDISNGVFSIGGPPEIVLNKTRFNFGYIKNGASPCVQTLFIYNGGGGTLDWSAEADASWINLNPSSGTGGVSVTIAINTIGLGTGTYMGTITISDPDVANSPQTAEVYLTVKNGNQDQVPFGTFATPEDGLIGVTGSIAVTGWALDDTCVESVKIYRQVNGGLSFIGDAVFVEGPRPDVEKAYPDYPNNYRAGWGYMLLTNFLPDGQLVLKAIARDTTGHQVELGTKTITVDNAHAIKPFGAIDTPGQGGDAAGSKYRNNGWALTPQPNKVPVDGSTINVFIDGVLVDNVNYNLYRADIAGLFPGYANSNGAWAYLDIDTTAYANGVHTIAWSVTDNAGNTDGIGSRYFSIQNTGGAPDSSAAPHSMGRSLLRLPTEPMQSPNIISHIPVDHSLHKPIRFKTGYENKTPGGIYPDDNGVIHLRISELERINIHLDRYHIGYMVVDGKPRLLPIGSIMDPKTGVFSWQPGPGFLGEYEFVFFGRDPSGKIVKRGVHITIEPGS
jgi:hypothetical protein